MKAAVVALLLGMSLFAGESPKIFFTKSFPNSMPAYAGIELSKDGSVVYKDTPEDAAPAHFKLSEADSAAIFALASKLDYFKNPLESNLKVAFMGWKTFRFEDGETKGEQKFNYSLNEDARALADYFERIIETQQQFWILERSVKFDKLGVNRSLLNLEILVDRKRMIAPERFLPLLDRVAKNESFLHMDRERAARLADLFRTPVEEPAKSAQTQ